MIPLRDSEPSHSIPYITILIIVGNSLVFFHMLSLDQFSLNHFVMTYGMVPARFDYASLFTSMFLHGGWLHFLGNMWFLWIYGDNVEDILGRWKYAIFYVACGVAAGLLHYIMSPESRVPAVGASGAIAGVMGAYLRKFPHSRILTLVPIFVFITVINVPAVFLLGYWFLIQLFAGAVSTGIARTSEGGVAWFAHVGGFITGLVLIGLMHTRPSHRRRSDLHW